MITERTIEEDDFSSLRQHKSLSKEFIKELGSKILKELEECNELEGKYDIEFELNNSVVSLLAEIEKSYKIIHSKTYEDPEEGEEILNIQLEFVIISYDYDEKYTYILNRRCLNNLQKYLDEKV